MRALLALLVLLGGAAPGDAFELKLWPLVDLSSREGETRLSLLGPVFEWRREAGRRSLSIRPLLHLETDSRTNETEGMSLYPLAWWQSSPDRTLVRVFGLLTDERRHGEAVESAPERRFTLFPFVFYRADPAEGRSLSVLPLFADLRGFAGYSRIRMLLFPLFLRLDEPLHSRSWLPFPFLSWDGGRLGSGFRLWPIYGRSRRGTVEDTRFVLWPFWIDRKKHVEHEGEERTRIAWPFFSVAESPRTTTRIWGFLLFLPVLTHTVDRERGVEVRGFPWPAWVVERELGTGTRRSLRLWPIYQDRETESLRSRFVAWPFYRRRTGLDHAYERTDVFFFVYRNERAGDRGTHALFPFWLSRSDGDHVEAQSLAVYEALFPSNEKIRKQWAPLWRLYGRDGERRDLLWRFVEWGDGGVRPPWYVSVAR